MALCINSTHILIKVNQDNITLYTVQENHKMNIGDYLRMRDNLITAIISQNITCL